VSTRTRWKCYKCSGRGGEDKKIPNSWFRRVILGDLDYTLVRDECKHCRGTEELMLSVEEVQRLKADDRVSRSRTARLIGSEPSWHPLKIEPLDPPIGLDRPNPYRNFYHCGRCGYEADFKNFPHGPGGRLHCPKCGSEAYTMG
jgi:hypothetical protein